MIFKKALANPLQVHCNREFGFDIIINFFIFLLKFYVKCCKLIEDIAHIL